MKFLRSKPLASTFFKSRGGPDTVIAAIPRYKFMFYANFVVSSAARYLYPQYTNLGDWRTGVSFKIHAIDKPNVEMTLTELNQYNRKRYAYTRVEYQPFTIKIFDTVDDITLNLWKNYFTYYFGDSRQKAGTTDGAAVIYNEMVTNGTFDSSREWGFNPVAERLNFFERLEIYAIYGGYYTQMNLINPKISRVDWQGYDTSSSDLNDVTMTLRYEAIEYKTRQRITANDAAKFGFDIEATLEPPGVPVPNQDVTANVGAVDIYALLQQSRAGMLPNDISGGISNILNIANSTLNLFNQLPIGAISRDAGIVLGQANRGLNTISAFQNTGYQLAGTGTQITNTFGQLSTLYSTGGLTTNPAAVSGFLGSGYPTVPNQINGSLNQFGTFKFGR